MHEAAIAAPPALVLVLVLRPTLVLVLCPRLILVLRPTLLLVAAPPASLWPSSPAYLVGAAQRWRGAGGAAHWAVGRCGGGAAASSWANLVGAPGRGLSWGVHALPAVLPDSRDTLRWKSREQTD